MNKGNLSYMIDLQNLSNHNLKEKLGISILAMPGFEQKVLLCI